jgi:diaminopimelate decarboxylase
MLPNQVELTFEQAVDIKKRFGTPAYVYSERLLKERAEEVLAFPHAHGLTARYAMKANPDENILRLFDEMGLHIDASSGYEVQRAILAGINPSNIQLTTNALPDSNKLREFISREVMINACSLQQIEQIGKIAQGSDISIRINPGEGSGGSAKTDTAGKDSWFGIWHGQIEEAQNNIERYGLNVTKLHTHIGSGADPEVWQRVAADSLQYAKMFPRVHTFNLGGGFKVARVRGEETTNLQVCGEHIKKEFEKFYDQTGRKLRLEIEPGTYLTANAGAILANVIDIKRTTSEHQFLIVNTGMTEISRISLYGAQHPLELICEDSDSRSITDYVVAGRCCETGDLITTMPGDPNRSRTESLYTAKIGDLFLIGGAGAYCESMSTNNYNSFPKAASVMIMENGKIIVIREEEPLEAQMRYGRMTN